LEEKIIFITGVLVLTLFSAKIVMVDFGEVNLDYGNLTEGRIKTAETYDLVINESLTWYGDFVVNETDNVLIENCDFTVDGGLIYVYGTLFVDNSTVWMRHVSLKFKYIYVYGNFTLSKSKILGSNIVKCEENSSFFMLDSFSPSTRCYATRSNVRLKNATSALFYACSANVTLEHSNCSSVLFLFDPYSKFLGGDSNIGTVTLFLQYTGDLTLRPGFVGLLTIYYPPNSANFTLVNTFVDNYYIYCQNFEGKFVNCIIETLDFWLAPDWSGNLTLTSSYITYLDLSGCTPHRLVIENSTVYEWRIDIGWNASVQFLDSDNICLDVMQYADVFAINSNVSYLCIYEDFSGTVSTRNATIDSANIRFMDSSINLTLKEGYYQLFNLYIPEQKGNLTLIDSAVKHWWLEAWSNATLNIFNSTLTKPIAERWCPYNLVVGNNASCFVCNSNVGVIYCSGYQELLPNLTLVNCMVDILYAYQGANVTAVNSTINMLITDPISVKLVNSKILLELDFSFEMTYEDAITSTFLEEFSPPLPENVQRFSQYVNITTAYDDYFQVRIHYNETELEEAGTSENDLQMYFLGESNIWQLCSIQGVNIRENYVWANVTHFSYFVLGVASGWKTGFIGLGGYPIVDFAVYNGKLYAAADNMLYVYDGNSWNIIDAPTFVVSLESYQDR